MLLLYLQLGSHRSRVLRVPNLTILNHPSRHPGETTAHEISSAKSAKASTILTLTTTHRLELLVIVLIVIIASTTSSEPGLLERFLTRVVNGLRSGASRWSVANAI